MNTSNTIVCLLQLLGNFTAKKICTMLSVLYNVLITNRSVFFPWPYILRLYYNNNTNASSICRLSFVRSRVNYINFIYARSLTDPPKKCLITGFRRRFCSKSRRRKQFIPKFVQCWLVWTAVFLFQLSQTHIQKYIHWKQRDKRIRALI